MSVVIMINKVTAHTQAPEGTSREAENLKNTKNAGWGLPVASMVTLNKRWDGRRLVCDFTYKVRLGRTQTLSHFWRKWKLLSHVWLFATAWTGACQATCPWNSPGKNSGVGCCSLLQGIFPTQGSNSGLCITGGFFTVWATRAALYLFKR